MTNAWSLAMCQNSITTEFKRTPESTLRAVRDAFTAQAGVIAASLAKRDARGFDMPLEGEAGFYGVYAGGRYCEQRLLRDAGTVFEGSNVSYKAWPSCRGTHAFIEAALSWHAQGIRPDDIQEIEMYGGAIQQMLGSPIERKRAPLTVIDAKFSAPFCVAAALTYGRITLDTFRRDALSDVGILQLACKASLSLDEHSRSDLVGGTTRESGAS